MSLRGEKPKKIEKRLKAFFYGTAGSGKTYASIQFPTPYLIDTERGAENEEYTEALDLRNGRVFRTSEFSELIVEIKELLGAPHPYKTLIIDPLTTLYNDLLDKSSLKVGTEYGRHYIEANKQMKHLMNLLTRLDMNVIITSHAKNEYGPNMSLLGSTFDCYKKLDYFFDLVIEVQRRAGSRVGVVKKSRIKSFEWDEVFPFSYDTIAEKYGRGVLERDATFLRFATEEQVNEIERLVELLHVEEEVVQKWLNKADSDSLKELPFDPAQKIIDSLLKRINGEKTKIENKSIYN